MTPTNEQRQTRLAKLPPYVKALYSSEAAGAKLRTIFNTYHLKPELYKPYAIAFGDVVLGFEEEGQMSQVLVKRVGLPEPVAVVIAKDLTALINQYKSATPKEETAETTKEPEVPEVAAPANLPRGEWNPPGGSSPKIPPSTVSTDAPINLAPQEPAERSIYGKVVEKLPGEEAYKRVLTDTPQYGVGQNGSEQTPASPYPQPTPRQQSSAPTPPTPLPPATPPLPSNTPQRSTDPYRESV